MKDKLTKYFSFFLCLLLSASAMLAARFYPRRAQAEESETRSVVRVWNVDTFEGGKGSRTAFLKRAASRVEKREKGLYYLITSFTPEGAANAFREGRFPDMISFGIGISQFAERTIALPHEFSGGEIGDRTYAYPWCRGGYALFSLTDRFDEPGRTAISSGGANLVGVAASLEGISGDELPSVEAYTRFLNGEYRYLLGTQRDLCRFETRGVGVFYRPLSSYCDLFQYLSILNVQKKEDCLALLEELLSLSGELDRIGMYPLEADGGFVRKINRTAHVFSSPEALREMSELARGADAQKKLENYLKNV